MTKIIQKIMDVIHSISIIFAIGALATQIIVITINVLLRQLGTLWTQLLKIAEVSWEAGVPLMQWLQKNLSGFSPMEELSANIMMPAVTFLSMAIGVKLSLHINVDLFPKNLPNILTIIMEKMKYILLAGIGIFIFYFSIIKMMGTFGIFSTMPFLTLSVQYIVLPLAGLLITLDSIFYLLELKMDHDFIDRFFMKIGQTKLNEEETGEDNHV